MQAKLYHFPREEQPAQAGLFAPDQLAADKLWYLIVGAFVFVLIVTSLALVTFALLKGQTDLLITVFTAVTTFLAGLVTPSPLGKRKRGSE